MRSSISLITLTKYLLLFQCYAAAAKLLQSCPTLCDPIDGSPPGSPVPGILPARTLEWVAISFSNAWKWKVRVVSDPQRPHGLQPSRLLHPRDFPVSAIVMFKLFSFSSFLLLTYRKSINFYMLALFLTILQNSLLILKVGL